MRIYLDNCCFNRPFDDQDQIRIQLETEATVYILEQVTQGRLELAWSYILDFENAANPFRERKRSTDLWKSRSAINIQEAQTVVPIAQIIRERGLKDVDSLHIACAIAAECDLFVSTDDSILKYANRIGEIRVTDPITFAKELDK